MKCQDEELPPAGNVNSFRLRDKTAFCPNIPVDLRIRDTQVTRLALQLIVLTFVRSRELRCVCRTRIGLLSRVYACCGLIACLLYAFFVEPTV